jgi:hypothetical protein
MEPFYREILPELQKLRYKGGKTLSDDEYLEMIVSFVQQIPYDNDSAGIRYPVEVIHDQKGDCDEKSILLTGLLSREGYDVGKAEIHGMAQRGGSVIAHVRIGDEVTSP